MDKAAILKYYIYIQNNQPIVLAERSTHLLALFFFLNVNLLVHCWQHISMPQNISGFLSIFLPSFYSFLKMGRKWLIVKAINVSLMLQAKNWTMMIQFLSGNNIFFVHKRPKNPRVKGILQA